MSLYNTEYEKGIRAARAKKALLDYVEHPDSDLLYKETVIQAIMDWQGVSHLRASYLLVEAMRGV